jgi:hypothetical protein
MKKAFKKAANVVRKTRHTKVRKAAVELVPKPDPAFGKKIDRLSAKIAREVAEEARNAVYPLPQNRGLQTLVNI